MQWESPNEANDGLSVEESAWRARFLDDVRDLFEERDVEVTPFIARALEEIVALSIISARLFAALKMLTPLHPEDKSLNRDFFACADMLMKALEKRRKAVSELEETCAKAGTPTKLGIADKMKPLVRQGSGVIELAITKTVPKPRKKKAQEPVLTSGEGAALS